MDLRKQYKRTLAVIGATLLLWAAFFSLFMEIVAGVRIFLMPLLNEIAAEIVASVLYDAAYLAAFMLPALFFKKFMGKTNTQPMRLSVNLKADSLAWIFGGIACGFAFATLNSMLMSFISVPETEAIIKEAEYMSDHSLILQFITIALVPAFCEEFLFRGVILSNLMPYGKGLAIIVSSVFFGLMHGNFYQFLYTMAAGMVLGLLYVITDSIWCSVLMHMINNSLSLLQTAVFEKFTEPAAAILWIIAESILFLVGLICIVYLVLKYGKADKKEKLAELGVARGLETRDAVKGIFNPATVIFIGYAIFNAVASLALLQA